MKELYAVTQNWQSEFRVYEVHKLIAYGDYTDPKGRRHVMCMNSLRPNDSPETWVTSDEDRVQGLETFFDTFEEAQEQANLRTLQANGQSIQAEKNVQTYYEKMIKQSKERLSKIYAKSQKDQATAV